MSGSASSREVLYVTGCLVLGLYMGAIMAENVNIVETQRKRIQITDRYRD